MGPEYFRAKAPSFSLPTKNPCLVCGIGGGESISKTNLCYQ